MKFNKFLVMVCILCLVLVTVFVAKNSAPKRAVKVSPAPIQNEIQVTSEAPVGTVPAIPILTKQLVALPPEPFLVEGCGSDECARHLSNTISCEVPIFAEASEVAPKVGALKMEDAILERILYQKVSKAGSYLDENESRFAIVSTEGEGAYRTFKDGLFGSLGGPDAAPMDATRLTLPESEEWAKIKMVRVTGWIKIDRKNAKPCPFELN